MISPRTIALVRERTDLVALIGENLRLQRRGRSFVGLCPFHKEKTPSFHVSAERGFFHCFGCKESGSAIDFVMKMEGKSFPEAVRDLAERAGIEIEETATDAERREAAAAKKSRDDLYAVNHLAAMFFEHNLHGGPGHKPHALAPFAAEELARRGLALPSPEEAAGPIATTLAAFRIGYAPYAWDGLAAYLQKQGISPVIGERVGLLVPRATGGGFYDRFRHRLMFAVVDVMGRVVAFSGRALREPDDDELTRRGVAPLSRTKNKDDDKPAKYINSPESPIYTKSDHLFGLYQGRQAIRQANEAVLVEGNFDVVSLHAAGVENVVAPLGTAFTDAQAKLLKRFAPAAVLLFDGDAAGKKATYAARVPCRVAGLDARVALLPQGLDPDELVRRRGAEALRKLVASARGLREHLIDALLEEGSFGGATLTQQLAKIRAVAQLLAEEDDPALRAMTKTYADRLSSKLIVRGQAPADLRQLEGLLKDALGPASQPRARADAARSPLRIEDRIGQEMLGALLDFPDLLDDAEVQEALGALDGGIALAVVALRQHRSGATLEAGDFLARVPPLIHPFAAARIASPAFEQPSDAKTELLRNADKLRRRLLTGQNDEEAERVRRLEAMGASTEEVNVLLRSLDQRLKKKRGIA